jgi:hypothetical protein
MSLDRRQFLATTSAGVGGLLWPGALQAAAARATEEEEVTVLLAAKLGVAAARNEQCTGVRKAAQAALGETLAR